MKAVRIFISSPGDVATERENAREVIAHLQKRYTGSLLLQPVLWEDLPLSSDTSFQEGIDYLLSTEHGIDIAVFILWTRLGSPLGRRVRKADGGEYLSGTEREWDLMLKARDASGGVRPDIFTYLRDDQNSFIEAQRDKDHSALRDMVDQQGKVKGFIAEHFTDQETGGNTRAYFKFKEPITFAHQLRKHLRGRLDGMLVDADQSAVVWHPAEQGSPFRGLEVFEYEHAPIFFGREQEICDVQIRLRQQDAAGCAFVLLVGGSGSGKSSLARAGVAPAVAAYDREDEAAEWRRAIFTPGTNKTDLLLGLAQALAAPDALPELAGENLAELAEGLARDPELTFRFKLRPLFAGHRRRLLLICDQIEELFTHGEIAAEALGRLGAALGVFARSGCVWVLGTVRSDYYAQFQGVPELLALKGEGAHVDLPPPALAELQRIITLPARAAGLRFEENDKGEFLDARLLADAAAHPEALPLLEFCLDVLFQRQAANDNDGVLRWADYEDMKKAAARGGGPSAPPSATAAVESGLAGALVSQAEAALASLPAEHQRQCLNAIFSKLLDLSSAVERETPVRRTATEAELVRNPYDAQNGAAELPGARAFLQAFTARRLLISGVTAVIDGQEPQRTYTVAHEALLRNWWRLRRLQAEQAEFFRTRRQVERAQADWLATKEDDSFLLAEGLPLQLAKKLAADAPEILTRNVSEYIARSATRVDRLTRRRLWTTAGVIAGLLLLASFAIVAAIIAVDGERAADKAKNDAQAAEKSARAQKEEAENQARIAKQTTDFVIGMFNRIDPAEARGRDITVREVLDQAGATVAVAFPGQRAVEYRIRRTLNIIYTKIGRPEQALGHATVCLLLAKKMRGDADDPEVADSLNNVAFCLKVLGRNAEALPKFEEALAMCRHLFKGDHADVATSLNNVAFCLDALGRRAEALPRHEEALAMFRRLFKGNHPDLANTLNGTALCLLVLGRSTEALPKFEEALAMCRRLFDGDHPAVANSLDNSALCLQALDRRAEALPRYEEALAMRRRLFKGDHPDVATSLSNVSFCLYALGRGTEALPKLEEALAMLQRLFKGDHPDVATLLGNVASCLQALGRNVEALPRYEEALAMRRRLFKGDHSDVAASLLDLGNCLCLLGRADGAIDNYQSAQELFRRLGRRVQVRILQNFSGEQGERLGLRAGDVILEYAGEPIFTKTQMIDLTGKAHGPRIELKIRRGPEVLAFTAQEGSLGCAFDDETVAITPASKP